MPSSPGRPRRASKEMLQEAAFELFQLRGYRGTTIEQIARTAGFSRATFFNFFPSKAELFWLETDELIAALRDSLEHRLAEHEPPQLREAILDHAECLSSASIPWALQNYRLLEAEGDLIASGAGRVLEINRALLRYLRELRGRGRAAGEGDAGEDREDPALAAQAAAATAVLLVALLGWIDAGAQRGSLKERLVAALPESAKIPPCKNQL